MEMDVFDKYKAGWLNTDFHRLSEEDLGQFEVRVEDQRALEMPMSSEWLMLDKLRSQVLYAIKYKTRVREINTERHMGLVEKGRPIVQKARTCFVDLDVEADGKPGYGSLLAIGAVTPQGATFRREIKPANEEYVPSMRDFNETHGFERDRLLDEGTPVDQVMQELAEWVYDNNEGKQVALTAFNAAFDFGWVDLEMTKAGVESPFGVAGYCLKSLAMSIPLTIYEQDRNYGFHSQGRPYDWGNTTKSNLPHLVVPQREFTHDPLDDALWQQELHFAMVGFLHRETPIESSR